jgi:hypothetical protein
MSSRTLRWLLALMIVAAAVLATWPVLRNGFINWDDHDQITLNPDFRPVRLTRMIDYWRGPYVGSLYPVSYNLFGVLAELGRGRDGSISSFVFHAASITLHAGSALVVFAILRLLVQRDGPACVGAVLFAVHPVQVEPVAWVSGMNTLLFALLSLWAIWQFLLATCADVSRARRTVLLASATIGFVLALWTKPTAVVTPLLAGLLVLTRRSLRPNWMILIVWLLLSIPIMLITRRMQTGELITPAPLWSRPFVLGDAIAFYLYKLAFPLRLLVDYGRTPKWVSEHPWTWSLLLVPVVIGAICWRARERYPWLGIAFAFFLLALLPVLGLTPFDVQMISTVTDRYLYLAMVAPAMALAFVLARIQTRGVYVAVAIALAMLAVRSNLRARQWHDEFTLFLPELRLNPRSLAAHQVLGVTYSAKDRPDLAAEHFRAALEVKPDDPRSLYNLGNILLRQQRFADAIPFYRAALVKAPRSARIHSNLGVALANTGRLDAAEVEFTRALELHPSLPEPAIGLRGVAKMRAASSQPSAK